MDDFDKPPRLEVPDEYQNQSPEENYEETENNEEKPTKATYHWAITGLAATVATVVSIFYSNLTGNYKELKEDYEKEKTAHKESVGFWMRRSDSLQKELNNCDDVALDELNTKIEKARQLRLSTTSDYQKVNREIEIANQNAKELAKATSEVKKAINNKK